MASRKPPAPRKKKAPSTAQVCEACGKPQPKDWKAGDLCVHCGGAARRDVRCFWCVKWTPAAGFCRSCGAEVVPEAHYGAARMLKAAGTDMFAVPKMLREADAGRLENFTRLYQRHAAVVRRHADDVRFLERFLFQKTFSAGLEEELLPQLPLPEETLAQYSIPPTPAGDDLPTVLAIAAATPFPKMRSLALLARVRLDDWAAAREAAGLLANPELRAEAALVLSGWRVVWAAGPPRHEQLVPELEKSPFRLPAAARLGLLGRGHPELLREALDADPETAFAAALALGETDRLYTSLGGDPLQVAAAGSRLIGLGFLRGIHVPLREGPPDVQRALLDALVRRKEPAPPLADTLLGIVETTKDATLRERAARVLCRRLDPGTAMKIARAAKGDRHILQSLLSQDAALSELAAFMVESGLFTMSQYGLEGAAERGAIPDGFVPAHFAAADAKTRKELLGLAEVQLRARNDEALHRFLMNVAFGPPPAELRAAAWGCLSRGYRRAGDPRGEGPLRLEKESIERFFGSVDAFLPKLAAVLRDPATLKEVGFYEFLAHLFSSAEPTVLPAILRHEAEAHDLVGAMLEAVRGDYWPYLVDGMTQFLGLVGNHPRRREEVLRGLEERPRKGNYHWDKAVRTLRYAALGVPDESEWDSVPDHFVPGRFDRASEEGRELLLKLAEQQVRARKDRELLWFLLKVALDPAHPDGTRFEALRIHQEEARGEPVGDAVLLRGIAGLFGSPLRDDDRFARFLRDHLRHAPNSPELKEAVRDYVASGTGALLRDARAWLERVEPPPPEPPRAPEPPPPDPVKLQKQVEAMARQLQEAVMRIMMGSAPPDQKTREAMRLQEEFQAKVKRLYGA